MKVNSLREEAIILITQHYYMLRLLALTNSNMEKIEIIKKMTKDNEYVEKENECMVCASRIGKIKLGCNHGNFCYSCFRSLFLIYERDEHHPSYSDYINIDKESLEEAFDEALYYFNAKTYVVNDNTEIHIELSELYKTFVGETCTDASFSEDSKMLMKHADCPICRCKINKIIII